MRCVEDVAPNLLFEPRRVAFELDRFELADGRLELTGRWFGVEGRRFMRPSLILGGDEGEVRLLADLADKPWAAENGEPWRAAFPCDGELDADDDAELTVAPDLTVELRVPDAARSRRDGRRRRRTSNPKPRADAEPKRDAQPKQDGRRSTPQPTVSAARQPVTQDRAQDEQSRALSSARAEIASLRERAEERGAELERLRTRFADELRDARQATAEAVQSREEAIAARRKAIESREIAQTTIEQALAARAKAKKAAERALAERGQALAQLEEALSQRDQALAQRDEAAVQRDEAAAQRDGAAKQRNEAVKDLQRVAGEGTELARANEQLRHQYEDTIGTRGAAMVMRNAAAPPSTDRWHARRLAVAIAVTSLLIVTLAVIIILSSH